MGHAGSAVGKCPSFSSGQPRCSLFSQQEPPEGANAHVTKLFVDALLMHTIVPLAVPAAVLHTSAHVAPCSSAVVIAV